MGGYGSGRTSYKQKAKHCRSLDVNRFHRDGCLRNGRQGNWIWSRDGEEVARIGYKTEDRRLVLGYRVRQNGGEWEPITETIQITQADCSYCNTRPNFICPSVVNGRQCRRRVGKLFFDGRFFLCRHCYNIAYASQSEARYDRMLRLANKLRMALGGEPGTAYWITAKPKGMWHRIYHRMVDEILWCEGQANLAVHSKFALFKAKQKMRCISAVRRTSH